MTRQELYDLIWSQPAKTIAPNFGISDVALSKLCEKHGIPQPPRGYWAKVAAGKSVAKFPLPARGLGIPEVIDFRRDRWGYSPRPSNVMELELGPPPIFPEPIETVVDRVRTLVGKVAIPRDLSRAHHAIQALLAQDEERRKVYQTFSYHSSFDAPLFGSPFERRRLRLMNAIAMGLARLGYKPTFSRGKDPAGIGYKVGLQSLGMAIDEPSASRTGWRTSDDLLKPAGTVLTVKINAHTDAVQTEWQDTGDDKVEDHVTDIVVMAITAGEIAYRNAEVSNYEWLVRRKAQLIEDARREKEERERKERVRLETERKARIDSLLLAAGQHRQANDIRNYVAAVRAGGVEATPEQVDRWAQWALKQADDLDPLTRFRAEGE